MKEGTNAEIWASAAGTGVIDIGHPIFQQAFKGPSLCLFLPETDLG